MAYLSKRTGKEVDALLDKVEQGGGGASITIDTELSKTSNNAIANSAVTEALEEKVSAEEVTSSVPTVDFPQVLHTPQNLTNEQKRVARENIYAMSNTPSGDPMHYAYEAVGAKWNANTGYWEFYDMKDITNIEMSRALARGSWYTGPNTTGVLAAFNPQSLNAIRFNVARTGAWGVTQDMDYFATTNSYIEFVNMTHDNNLVAMPFTYVTYLNESFNGCSNLRRIYGELELSNVNGVRDAFKGCAKLESVLLYGLKDSISFADSPLSVESATYMIANANASSSFTITFRADRQAIFEANSDFIVAKSAKPNITILYQ